MPVLARAFRNGAPFRDWVLPAALDRTQRKLAGSDDCDRQFVKILAAVLSDGQPAVEGVNICAAHNCDFDRGFLPMLADGRWIDTLQCAKHVWPDAWGSSVRPPGLPRRWELPILWFAELIPALAVSLFCP